MTTKNFYRPSVKEMENAINGLKQNNQEEVQKLYEWFKPLIIKIAYNSLCQAILHEDAQNIAWEYFFDFLIHYDKKITPSFPGLIKLRVSSRVNDRIGAEIYRACENLDDVNVEENEAYMNKYWEDTITNLDLKLALNKISLQQQKLIDLHYFKDITQKEIAKQMHVTAYYVRTQHLAALYNLKTILTT